MWRDSENYGEIHEIMMQNFSEKEWGRESENVK